MTAPIPAHAGRSPYGPRPPSSRPLLYGRAEPPPQLVEGVAVTCGGKTFVPRETVVWIDVDGYPLPPMPWGRIEVQVIPGRHRFRVFLRRGEEIVSVAETDEEVRPGELLELAYGFPAYPGNSDSARPQGRRAFLVAEPSHGGRVAVVALLFGFIAVTMLLLIGAALLLR
ncbi:MAG: hypothetical protein WBA05_16710 [Gordonia sp. (in: high G+C Gram-positive bacteria)]|uniref:hypothetical protein n=1 Tax=Gordonia sp. (in: high G+C Gram-positive bacteria) TaxID=84139 RepID=UPI003C7520AE